MRFPLPPSPPKAFLTAHDESLAAAALLHPTVRPWLGWPDRSHEGFHQAVAHDTDKCGTRTLMRGTNSWTCVDIDGERLFAPTEVATLPAPGIETGNTAAICLVGQVRT